MKKIEIKFVGINNAGYKCYVTQQGDYIAEIEGEYYILNQAPEYGFEGIDGEVAGRLNKNMFTIVNKFKNEK